MGELMEYTDLLDKAAATEDPYERWVWLYGVCVWRVGGRTRPAFMCLCWQLDG
jgi:hypothetical protein